MTVGDALAQHYLVHGLPADGGAGDRWFRVRIGRFGFRLPNPPARRRAVFFHDVNHLATGYNTKFGDGEMAIAGFEVGAGCGRFTIVWIINLSLFAVGLLVRPGMVFRAFVRGRHSASIYHDPPAPAVLATMSIAELHCHLRLDTPPITPGLPEYLSFAMWGFGAFTMVLGPAALVLRVLLVGLRAWDL